MYILTHMQVVGQTCAANVSLGLGAKHLWNALLHTGRTESGESGSTNVDRCRLASRAATDNYVQRLLKRSLIVSSQADATGFPSGACTAGHWFH